MIPDSFPFVLEREFGPEAAQGYESYAEKQTTVQMETVLNYTTGVDYMNQVISYDRLVFFGRLQEKAGLVPTSIDDKAKKYTKPKVENSYASPQKERQENFGVSPIKQIRESARKEMIQLAEIETLRDSKNVRTKMIRYSTPVKNHDLLDLPRQCRT